MRWLIAAGLFTLATIAVLAAVYGDDPLAGAVVGIYIVLALALLLFLVPLTLAAWRRRKAR